MNKLTPTKRLPKRQSCQALSLSILTMMLATTASAATFEIPAVKNGLNLSINGSANPRLTTEYDKFNYTYGDPKIFGSNGTLADVLMNQDRKDSDEQLRLDGVNWTMLGVSAKQRITPKMTANASVVIEAGEGYVNNWGAYWGAWLDFGTYGEKGRITIGGQNNGLGVSQTGIGIVNTLTDGGTNINGRYMGIPNLTLSAYHMFSQSADINDNTKTGWHDSNGIAAKYDFEFAPRKTLSLAGGYSQSKGHDQIAYFNTSEKANAYLAGVSFQHNDLTVDLDYGKRNETYNGAVTHGVDKDTYGIKVNYEFTPRLQGSISYGRSQTDNKSPAPVQRLVSSKRLEPQGDQEALFFHEVKKDRYSAELSYQLYQGISLTGSITNLKTRNYTDEGEFSNRKHLTFSTGASFSF